MNRYTYVVREDTWDGKILAEEYAYPGPGGAATGDKWPSPMSPSFSTLAEHVVSGSWQVIDFVDSSPSVLVVKRVQII